MEGRILGNRYELLEKIGGGGMALVYKAKCKLLDRFVAIKILRPEFTNDEEFVKRFRIEAQAAARLSHPNIVSIHDVGQEDNLHYIVMEYVDGITLKDYIHRKGALPWREAVNIAIQICSALEQAHRNHIVHRDIKPHNILLTRDGIAKVTDFGIARAVSSSTITMVGSTIGSVHYFSPEQARGGYTDEKSDLYSLGITLYEMVTGKVPFDGETPVAIALKHIQEKAPEPRELNDKIPCGINDIIVKAIRKEQNARYQTASDMLYDLNSALANPNGDFSSDEPAEDIPTRKIKVIGDDDIDAGINQPGEKELKKKKKDKLAIILAIITGVLIVSIFSYIGWKLVKQSILPQSAEITVDNYVGRDYDDVKAELAAKNIEAKKKEVYDESVPKGTIKNQSIEPGQTLKEDGNNYILFEVSKGTETVTIPDDLRNKELRIAEVELKQLNLKVSVMDEYNDTVGKDLVTRTEPGMGSDVKPGSVVTVYKSLGPERKKVKVPNLMGLTRSQAQQVLLDNKLKVGNMVFTGDVVSEVAKVQKQTPAALTEVDEDTAVDMDFTVQNSDGQNSQTSGNGGDEGQETTRQNVISPSIELSNPDKYGDTIKVQVEITPSDTNKTEVLTTETINKSSFPIKLQIPVPENGSTKVTVILDDDPYKKFTVTAD